MTQALLPAWKKTHESIVKQIAPTASELELLDRMTMIFEAHYANARSMTGH
jgi:hypothetical protein